MEQFLSQLNSSQREAVEYNDGPSLIIAGAGSGKTRVLTYKIAYLILQGIAPYNILALTFTNKAAREMKQRVADVVGQDTARRLWMGTFHSVFSRILRREADKVGFTSNFTVYDTSDSKNLIKTILKDLKLDVKKYKPGVVQSRISNAKNALFTPQQYAVSSEIVQADIAAHLPEIGKIYQMYWNRCRNADAMDFDDLLLYTNILFSKHSDVLERYQEQFRFVLVDEYQDTNFAQHIVVKQLAEQNRRVCVVGDDAQSIYSFRGADIGNILNFRRTYPEAKLFKLEQNYRSSQTIVNAANSLIVKNTEQIYKNVFSEKEKGEKIQVVSAYSDLEEGYAVAARITEMRMLKKYGYSDFAILYRTNAQSRIFEEALRKRNIPYKIFGGLSFFQRKEIKNIIAYFKMAVNSRDEEALKRTINYPARGIGATTIDKIGAASDRHNVSLWQVVDNPLNFNLEINAGTAAKLSGYKQLILSLAQKTQEEDAFEAGHFIMKETGVVSDLYNDKTPEGLSRVQNAEELLNSLKEFVDMRRQEGGDDVKLTDFLSEISLLTDQDNTKEDSTDHVTLMTVHASKGLEFKNVFVVGMEEDLFPLGMSAGNARALEEERRLFYVAITRAEDNCLLSYAKNRFQHGKSAIQRPSRFLSDIDQEYLNLPGSRQKVSSSFGYKRQTTSLFQHHEREIPERMPPTPYKQKETDLAADDKTKPQTGSLSVGYTIQHDRFGIGVVTDTEGKGENAKATVEFENFGRKQLLLKFAKFQIVG